MNQDTTWYDPRHDKPVCYQQGDWDGLRSNQVLIERTDGSYSVATCYEGFMDGSHFFDWYEGPEEWSFSEDRVRRWMKIPQ